MYITLGFPNYCIILIRFNSFNINDAFWNISMRIMYSQMMYP